MILARTSRKGIALLETLIALAILSVAGLSTVALVSSLLRAQAESEEREEAVTTAGRVLAAATLLRREELDQRLGSQEVGEFLLDVQRPEKALYRIALREKAFPDVDLLVTLVYRP